MNHVIGVEQRDLAARLLIQRGRTAPEVDRSQTERTALPQEPTIAVYARGVGENGDRWGNHAGIYLAFTRDAEEGMIYIKIDLQDPEGVGQPPGITIVPLTKTGWAKPEESKSWRITDEGGLAALAYAQNFRANAHKYTYSKTGMGRRSYNCALFAEKMLHAAGVSQASAGVFASTPNQLVSGKPFE